MHTSERRRYARAVLAGLAIGFVMLIAAPWAQLTYVLAIALFVVAGVLYTG